MQDFPGFETEYYEKHGIEDPARPSGSEGNKDAKDKATDKA